MSIPNSCDPIPTGKWQTQRTLIAVLGMLVFAASVIGVWFSLGQSATAQMPDVRPVASAQEPSSFTPYALPRPVANVEFEDGQGRKRTLADFRGKVVLLNIWATWCGPCRAEMPTLDRLQAKLGSKDFEVVALSIDRGGQTVVKSFFDAINVRALTIYVDATAAAQDKLGVVGIPTTVLIDREGREVARHIGPARWDRPEVIDIIRRYLPAPKT
jgi:thiol-disulfide isomerase/thioredoxin